MATLSLGLAIGLAAPALAQTPGQGPGPGNYGPGMMQQRGAPGPGGGWHRGWGGKAGLGADLAVLKEQLKITAEQEAAWKEYVEVTEAAQEAVLGSMRGLFQSGHLATMTPEERLTIMGHMITLREQELTKMKAAAEKLMPHLTDFQRGQATELLPGLATGGFGMGGYGMGGFGGGGWGGWGGERGFMGPGMEWGGDQE